MNKTFKKLSYVFSCICAFFVCGIVANAASAPEVIDGDVYANGTPITISAKADGSEGAHITWANGSFDVEKKARIFGGSKDASVESSSVTMTGGTVNHIFGGGYGTATDKSANVDNATVKVTGGNIINSIYGGGVYYSLVKNIKMDIANATFLGVANKVYPTIAAGGAAYDNDQKKDAGAGNTVDKVTVNITNVDLSHNYGMIYGGPQGTGIVKDSNVTINGNTKVSYVTVGGSNGTTIKGNVTVNGGTIDVFQGVNRGTINSATTIINSGTITNFYVGGESGDSSVSGIIENANVKIMGGTIQNFKSGQSNKKEITEATTGVTTDVTYVEGTVTNITGSLPVAAKELVKNDIKVEDTNHGTVTVPNTTDVTEGTEVTITVNPDKGYQLKSIKVFDAAGNFVEVKDNKFIMPDSDVTIQAEFEKIEVATNEPTNNITNPETNDSIILMIILAILSISAIAGVTYKLKHN